MWSHASSSAILLLLFRGDALILTCASTLARIEGTFRKITLQANEGIVKATGKRVSRKSPTGDLANSTKRHDQFESCEFPTLC